VFIIILFRVVDDIYRAGMSVSYILVTLLLNNNLKILAFILLF